MLAPHKRAVLDQTHSQQIKRAIKKLFLFRANVQVNDASNSIIDQQLFHRRMFAAPKSTKADRR